MTERSRVLIKKSSVAGDGPLANTPAAGNASARPHAETSCARPEVVLHRNGEDIEAIEITCPCGHVMILECEYK